MKILITGASSGMGLEFARYLANKENKLYLIGRNKEALLKVQEELEDKTDIRIITADLSSEAKAKELYVLLKNEEIDFLINNAAFGDLSYFSESELAKDLEMIDLNIKALHILTKLFLKDMLKRDKGYILNVSSMAALAPGPLMSTYYATKAYVKTLTTSIQGELKALKSNVQVSLLLPGEFKSNFQKRAGVRELKDKGKAEKIAKYGVDKTLKGKDIIIPGFKNKLANFFKGFISNKTLAKKIYKYQNKKFKKD